jgi:hypothetical protein
MNKVSILLLCCALIFVPLATSAAIGVRGQNNISLFSDPGNTALSAITPVNFSNIKLLDPVTPNSLGNYIMQFKAGSHIMGFKPDRVYLVNTAGFLSIEFMETRGVMPKVAAGKSQSKGQGLEQLGKVEYQDLWKGITLSYERVGRGIAESTYRIKPGANAGNIRLRYSAETELQKDGSLRIKLPTDRGWMIESKPMAWQEIEGKRIPVGVAFTLDDGQLGFRVSEYDRNRDLIIDPTYQWHTFYGSDAGDYGHDIAVDDSGNVYVTGYSNAPWNGPGATPPLTPFSGHADIFVLKLDASGAYQWHAFYGSDVGYNFGNSIAVDGSGNVYVTGYSFSTWNGLGATPPLNPFSNNTGAGPSPPAEIFVLKLDASGAYQWHTFYGSGKGDTGNGIAVDGSGNVYVTGYGDATWNGPGATPPLNPFSNGTGWIPTLHSSIFVLKLNTSGAYQWHTFYGSDAGDGGNSIAIDGSGNLYVTGYSHGTWNGPGATPPLNPYSGSIDILVLKLNASGAYQWHTFYGSTAGDDFGNSIAVDDIGNVYVTGSSSDPWNGPGATPPLNAYSTNISIFVLKLNTSGAYQWHTFYGSVASDDYGSGIAVDGSGNVYVTGNSDDTWNGPGATPPLNAYSSGVDIFLLKLDTSGAYQWHIFCGSVAGDEYGQGIAVDGSGNVYVTGFSGDTWNGPKATPPLNAYSGSANIFVLKLLSDTSQPSVNEYTLTVTKSGVGNGTIMSSSKGINCGSDCDETFPKNVKPKTVTLKVKPDANSTFLGWGGDCQASGTKTSCKLTMDSDKNVTASFGLPNIAVSPNSYDFGDVTVKQSSSPVTFTIQNNGTGNLKITKTKIIGTDAKVFKIKGSCKKTIFAEGNCQFTITLKPTSTGSKTATLQITSNDPDTATVEIPLSGTGM